MISCVAQLEPRNLFSELEQSNPDLYLENRELQEFSGDVPIHSSASNRIDLSNGKKILVDISPNSCHLESINPIHLGAIKAKIDQFLKSTKKVLPVIVHGDSSITGQGVVFEAQILEQLKNYSIGGTVHIILNNYLGNENSQTELRTSYHASNISRINENFVIFVSNENPEKVDFAIRTAIEYRQKFQRDVFIEIYGYKRPLPEERESYD